MDFVPAWGMGHYVVLLVAVHGWFVCACVAAVLTVSFEAMPGLCCFLCETQEAPPVHRGQDISKQTRGRCGTWRKLMT